MRDELTDKEKEYIANILFKQDWTEAGICKEILKKIGYEENEVDHQSDQQGRSVK